jgi:fatty-acyl-CoA synthase
MVEVIRRERPTLIIMVPALAQALLDHPAWPTLDFSCVRCMNTGSTTVPAPLLRTYLDRGIAVAQIYGSTETAPIVIHQRYPDARRTAGSTGKPALHCAAKICAPDGRELPPGEKGEIVVRGPNIMSGYWRDPDATAAVLKDGWFWTGDAGHTDADGNFYVDDRIKDVIISGSENIYPAEVELVLDECPEIAESAVVARADARWGEVPVACVARKSGSAITREEVLKLYQGRLARFKHPHDVVFMQRLPRNVMGKILKFELRAMIAPKG